MKYLISRLGRRSGVHSDQDVHRAANQSGADPLVHTLVGKSLLALGGEKVAVNELAADHGAVPARETRGEVLHLCVELGPWTRLLDAAVAVAKTQHHNAACHRPASLARACHATTEGRGHAEAFGRVHSGGWPQRLKHGLGAVARLEQFGCLV